ncbi:hypothetical protein X744_20765 [Mesorhizobium sp. LNJC372A00]|jgi:hypothetical protein|nr:hypothetical protein X753_00020 [Mesorhizobium sp. LNJC399B00]ESY24320.1 hypothetical protein X750_09640 [Mesorhizobium sp. LNJC394B00]ESY56829.1 hypothetical protein X744_20765 [Mesorhizobium sp. LNJC372A00]
MLQHTRRPLARLAAADRIVQRDHLSAKVGSRVPLVLGSRKITAIKAAHPAGTAFRWK